MKKMLLICLFALLSGSIFAFGSADYSISENIDLATGETVIEKRDSKTNELIWEKRHKGCRELYEKLSLSHYAQKMDFLWQIMAKFEFDRKFVTE